MNKSELFEQLLVELFIMAMDHDEPHDDVAIMKEFMKFCRTGASITYYSTSEFNRKAEEAARAYAEIMVCRRQLMAQGVNVYAIPEKPISMEDF